jgi:L-fucose isomerase-like protein
MEIIDLTARPERYICGTLEDKIKPGEVTLFRLQGRAQGGLENIHTPLPTNVLYKTENPF